MTHDKKKLCSLCGYGTNNAEVIKGTTKDILEAVSLELRKTLTQRQENFLCKICFEKLSAALRFKSTCLDTEDKIMPYINNQQNFPIDMEDVYISENDDISALKRQKKCRFCMQVTNGAFVPLDQVDLYMTSIFLAEINLQVVKDPVLCTSCCNCLNLHNDFLKTCLTLQETFDSFKNQDLKCEPIDLYQMGDDLVIKNEPVIDDVPFSEKALSDTAEQERNVQNETHRTKDDNKELFIVTTSRVRKKQSAHEKETYACQLCDYKTKSRSTLRNHLKVHKDPVTDMYKCAICGYREKYWTLFLSHMLKHGEYSKDRMYQCELCSHRTKYKTNLKIHMTQHEGVKVHRCGYCKYESKYKQHLLFHSLAHKPNSEVRWFRCFTCGYSTKNKSALVKHITKRVCKKDNAH